MTPTTRVPCIRHTSSIRSRRHPPCREARAALLLPMTFRLSEGIAASSCLPHLAPASATSAAHTSSLQRRAQAGERHRAICQGRRLAPMPLEIDASPLEIEERSTGDGISRAAGEPAQSALSIAASPRLNRRRRAMCRCHLTASRATSPSSHPISPSASDEVRCPAISLSISRAAAPISISISTSVRCLERSRYHLERARARARRRRTCSSA